MIFLNLMLLFLQLYTDTLYLKQVIKQLNIEDLQRGMSSTHKQEVASIEGDTGNEVLSFLKLTHTVFNTESISLAFFLYSSVSMFCRISSRR